MKTVFKFYCLFMIGLSLHAQQIDTLSEARSLVKARNFQRAVVLLDEYIKYHTEDTFAAELNGDAYVELGLYSLAEQHYSRALTYCKNNGPLKRKRAITFFLLQEYRSAKPEWQSICKTDPYNKQNWYYLGLVQSRLGNHKESLQALNRAIEIDHIFIEARILRAEINLKEQRYREVLIDIDTALKMLQYTEELFINRGLALLGLKRYAEASQMFERVIKKNDQQVHAWFGLGNVQYSEKKYEASINTFSKVISLKPNFELAYFKRGLALMETSKTEDACKDLLQSASLGYADAIFYVQKYCNGIK